MLDWLMRKSDFAIHILQRLAEAKEDSVKLRIHATNESTAVGRRVDSLATDLTQEIRSIYTQMELVKRKLAEAVAKHDALDKNLVEAVAKHDALDKNFAAAVAKHNALGNDIADIRERALLREQVADMPNQQAIFESEFHCQKSGRLLGVNGHPLTDEQIRIWEFFRDEIDDMIINAFAGAGKTSTILTLAHLSPHLNFLYIAYNNEIARETKQKLAEYKIDNVECRTSHSHALAMCKASKELQAKVSRGRGNKPKVIERKLELSKDSVPAAWNFCWLLQKTIGAFLSSDAHEISEIHIPVDELEKYLDKAKPRDPKGVPAYLVRKARVYWAMLIDPNDKDLTIQDDVYVKVWHLSNPTINGYDCILFDEAQDANPPLLDIIKSQQCRKVYVGDKHQQIYSWRGAVNSLSMVSGRELYLTQSFRFGPAVAHYANGLLKMLGEKNQLVGFDRIPTVASSSCVDLQKPYTVLAAVNKTLLQHLIDHVLGKRIYFKVAKDYQALKQQLLYCWGLKYPKFAVEPPEDFETFESWRELQEFAENEPSYQKLVNLVEEHDIPKLVAEMDEFHVDSEINEDKNITPHVILSTAHSSKGAEYDQVILMEDFWIRNRKKDNRLEPENVRLLYVAVTRAKKAINLNALLLNQGKYAALIKAGVRKMA